MRIYSGNMRMIELMKMSMQIWKDIEGYKGHYQISNYGNVRSLKKDAFLMKGGYLKGYK